MMFENTFALFAPRSAVHPRDWMSDYVQTPEGRPFDHLAYPYFAAPGGPLDALADPKIRTIWMMFGSRLGKTFFAQAAMHYFADVNPGPMMFASESEKLATEVIARGYKMLARNPRLRDDLMHERLRRQDRVEFRECTMSVAWARSVSTLADKAVRWGHANEIDKWEHQTTSKEADPLKLFDDRFKEFPTHKRIKESTPTVKGRSRVERGVLQSDNRRYQVPCPHCRRYAELKMPGIVWDHVDGQKSDPILAQQTALYVCPGCGEKIQDHEKQKMIRRGVWAPEGCGVDDEAAWRAAEVWQSGETPEYLTGTSHRKSDEAGFTLSSLYASSLTWGTIAAEFLRSKDRPQELRNFINQWLAETWEHLHRKQTWQQLGERVASDVPRGIVPTWASFLTVGVDRQQDIYVWCVDAWGPNRQCHTVAYGDCETLDWLLTNVLQASFQHADGGAPVRPLFTLIDSGYKPTGVYEFCRETISNHALQVWPCKGSNVALEAEYVQRKLGENTSMPGMVLFHVDTIRTQGWIDRQLHVLQRDDVGGYGLHEGPLEAHQDFLEQLLNDAAVSDLDTRNNERESWERINANVPNDFRDCRRYAYAAMLIATRGATIGPRSGEVKRRSAVLAPGIKRESRL